MKCKWIPLMLALCLLLNLAGAIASGMGAPDAPAAEAVQAEETQATQAQGASAPVAAKKDESAPEDKFAEDLAAAWKTIKGEFPKALWETIYSTLLATFFAILLGMPLGMLLVAGGEGGFLRVPGWLMKLVNIIINLLRSVPFTIMIVTVIPLTRLIMGTTLGTGASIVPLVVAAFPFVARLVESSLREVNPNIIETAHSMGATPMQILLYVMLPESVPSLITNFTLAVTTIMGYTAMSGAVGGGGLGRIAIVYGYTRFDPIVMYSAVAVLVVLVQIIQSFGTWLSIHSDKRLKN